ncbi:MAG: hypothetical protein ABJK20_03415, partial [Halieaceae bacterium]
MTSGYLPYRLAGGSLLIGLLLALMLALPAFAQPQDAQERAELRSFLDDTINSADSFQDRYDAEVWLVDMS